jgi:AcrR family transcriptional regulator
MARGAGPTDATSPARTPRLAPAERRAQLLDATLHVVFEEGFGAVTVEAVAQRAGVTRPVVYDQFGDLDGLLVALIDTAEATALAPLLRIVDVEPGDDVDPERFLFDSVHAFLCAVRADPRTWKLILAPPHGGSPELSDRIRRSRRLIADHVTALLDWGVPLRGGPVGLDHELSARVVVAAFEDAARLMLAYPRRFTPERLRDVTRELLTLLPPGVPSQRLPRPQIPVPSATASGHTAPPAAPVMPVPGPPPPAPARRMPQSQRREQLLDVTLALLAEDGFGALSMEAVARRAGVNRAVVYRSFANSGVLLVTLLHREERRIRATIDHLVPSSPVGSPGELLAATLAAFLEDVLASPQTWRVALLRPEAAPVPLQKIVNRRRSAIAEQLQPLIRWGLSASPELEPGDEDLVAMARMLLSAAEELARLTLDDPEFPLERVVEGSWALLDVLPSG